MCVPPAALDARAEGDAGMAGQQQPWWIADGCPPWCIEDHSLQEQSGDRIHQGYPRPTAAVQLRRVWADDPPPTMTKELVADNIDVVRYRYAGELDEWVCISGDGGDIDLTVESARRLLEALRQVVEGP